MKLVLLFSTLWFCASSHASESAVETITDSDNNYWFSAFSLASIEAESAQDGGGRTSTYNYLSINRRGEGRTHWALRIPFTYATAGFDNFNENENQPQELALADLIIDYTINRALLPFDIEVFSRYRLQLPTGEFSIAQKKIAGLRVDYIASKNLTTQFNLEYWPQFTWHIHSQTVYQNPNVNGLSHTKRYELDQRLTLWYRAHQRLSIGFYVGGEDTWFNESDVNNTGRARDGRYAEHLLKVGPSVRFVLNRNYTFLFNLQNSVPLWGYTADRTGQMSDLGAFRPEHTQFVLLSFVNF